MKIKERMMERGLNCTQVADALGLATASVYHWTIGVKVPATNRLPALAKLLGCSIDDLFDDDAASQYQHTKQKGD